MSGRGLPSEHNQLQVLAAAFTKLQKRQTLVPGGQDIDDYNIGALWRRGLDGAGTTIAVLEGWNDPAIARQVAKFDKATGLPTPSITTIYPAGPLPKKCPPGMTALGTYGACPDWAGEIQLDVEAAHLIAPYARIVIAVTPADTEVTEDAASQVAPPEMMKSVEYIAAHHLANVISISDGNGESSYSHGAAEILAQDPGELAAAAAGIPIVAGTGDCGVVQNLPVANGQCEDTSTFADSAAWDDSPWVTAVGGTIPNLTPSGAHRGPDPLWTQPHFGTGAGLSKVFRRPAYQDGVANITHSQWRSMPDLTMDSRYGTSESGPLLAGVLALATQENNGNVGPINPVLYATLGPAGARDGIIDVTSGNNSSTLADGKVVKGYAAAKGFDVASGWGTIDAARFVPSLVAATKAAAQDARVRRQAQSDLKALETRISVSPSTVPAGGSCRVRGLGFLPDHPVRVYVDGHRVARVMANGAGTVNYVVRPGRLDLTAGQHQIVLTGMLLTQTARFRSG